MDWYEAKRELQENCAPMAALGYCKIAFDLGQRAMEMENARLRKYIQGQHEATLQTIDAYQKQIEALTCKKL